MCMTEHTFHHSLCCPFFLSRQSTLEGMHRARRVLPQPWTLVRRAAATTNSAARRHNKRFYREPQWYEFDARINSNASTQFPSCSRPGEFLSSLLPRLINYVTKWRKLKLNELSHSAALSSSGAVRLLPPRCRQHRNSCESHRHAPTVHKVSWIMWAVFGKKLLNNLALVGLALAKTG